LEKSRGVEQLGHRVLTLRDLSGSKLESNRLKFSVKFAVKSKP
jgi:hypothetical protein